MKKHGVANDQERRLLPVDSARFRWACVLVPGLLLYFIPLGTLTPEPATSASYLLFVNPRLGGSAGANGCHTVPCRYLDCSDGNAPHRPGAFRIWQPDCLADLFRISVCSGCHGDAPRHSYSLFFYQPACAQFAHPRICGGGFELSSCAGCSVRYCARRNRGADTPQRRRGAGFRTRSNLCPHRILPHAGRISYELSGLGNVSYKHGGQSPHREICV